MNPFCRSGRIPGPLGMNLAHPSLREAGFGQDLSFSSQQRMENPKVIKMTGPYPRIDLQAGEISTRGGALQFQSSSATKSHLNYANAFPNGETHTEILFKQYQGLTQDNYEVRLPNGPQYLAVGKDQYIGIPAGSRVFTTTIPLEAMIYKTSEASDQLAKVQERNPNAILFAKLEDKCLKILGFNPPASTTGTLPSVGRKVAHMYSNSAYTLLQNGTLTPDETLPTMYYGTREPRHQEIEHEGKSYNNSIAAQLNTLNLHNTALKVSVWEPGNDQIMVAPTAPSSIIRGAEISGGHSKEFYYLDKVAQATAHSIELKPGEKLSTDLPALRDYLEANPAALHLCRVYTDFKQPDKPKRIDILSIQ